MRKRQGVCPLITVCGLAVINPVACPESPLSGQVSFSLASLPGTAALLVSFYPIVRAVPLTFEKAGRGQLTSVSKFIHELKDWTRG
jgi:hypothetical protein